MTVALCFAIDSALIERRYSSDAAARLKPRPDTNRAWFCCIVISESNYEGGSALALVFIHVLNELRSHRQRFPDGGFLRYPRRAFLNGAPLGSHSAPEADIMIELPDDDDAAARR